MIQNILILDTETTGLSPKKGDKIIELAVVLFNIKHKAVLQCFSTLLPCDANPVESINHISAESTRCNYPYILEDPKLSDEDREAIWQNPDDDGLIYLPYDMFYDKIIYEMWKDCQAIVAHNAEFDRLFVETLPRSAYLLEKPWICTRKNFTWPVHLPRMRLEDVCNGMKVPYVQAHRGLNDCLLLAQCFQKVEDLESRFDRL